MAPNELRAALGSLVERHGFRKVYRFLREMEPGEVSADKTGKRASEERTARKPRETTRPRRAASENPRRRPSAVDYVRRLELTPARGLLMARAAEAFDQRAFLPTRGDLRVFCEAYGIEEPRARSRSGAIPRIFRFLVTMDAAELRRILDDELFTGPTRLGPIADAIRSRARQLRETPTPRH